MSVGVDRVGAVVGGETGEADRVLAVGQLDLHFLERHLRRLLAAEFGVERLPDAFEGGRCIHAKELRSELEI